MRLQAQCLEKHAWHVYMHALKADRTENEGEGIAVGP